MQKLADGADLLHLVQTEAKPLCLILKCFKLSKSFKAQRLHDEWERGHWIKPYFLNIIFRFFKVKQERERNS